MYKGDKKMIIIDKKIHSLWKANPDYIGKYQYVLSNGNQSISIVEIIKTYGSSKWEVFQIKGDIILFDDIIRFDSYKEAEDYSRKLLN